MTDHDPNSLPVPAPDPNPASIPSPPAASEPETAAALFKASLRDFLAWNPMYLVSAVLLLYSFCLISADRTFLPTEIGQLSFNLGSLQLYEPILVGTAIFLAGRRIWYDSTLLVGLENLLILVPFVLVSQAALIEPRLVWLLCAAAASLAAGRMGLLKRFIGRLNYPSRFVWAGLAVLFVNAVLPILYRILHESKFGVKIASGPAYETNQFVWWLLLPGLCVLSLLIPLVRGETEIWPRRYWLPLGCYSLWLVGTVVHLYCLGYVYDFDLRPDLLAPAAWTLLWLLYLRVERMVPELAPGWRNALWAFPLLATMLAVPQPSKQVFIILTALNLALYAALYFRERASVALHLVFLSLVALVAGFPEDWGRGLVAEFSREKFIGGAAAGYVLICTALSRKPKLGLLGALVAGGTVALLGQQETTFHWAFQIGVVFLLLHSLRWTPPLEEGASLLRWLAALAWVTHSFVWVHAYDGGWATCALAAPLIALLVVLRWWRGSWPPALLAVAALLVVLSPGSHLAVSHARATPPGLLAVLGSFALFGLGTLAALAKPANSHKRTT